MDWNHPMLTTYPVLKMPQFPIEVYYHLLTNLSYPHRNPLSLLEYANYNSSLPLQTSC